MSETPMYLQIKDYLETVIRMNASIPNYRLPSENQLAKQFGVSNPTVRRALAILEAENKIRRLQGKGAFAHTAPATANRRYRVCIVVPGFGDHLVQQLIVGAENYLSKQNVDTYLKVVDDDYTSTMEAYRLEEERKIHAVIRHDFHGMLVFPGHQSPQSKVYTRLAMSHFPTVELMRHQPGLPISHVHCDHYQQLYEASRFLHNRGHHRIAFFTEPAVSSYTYAQRVEGYTHYVQQHIDHAHLRLMQLNTFTGNHYDPLENLQQLFATYKDITALIIPCRFLWCLQVLYAQLPQPPDTLVLDDLPPLHQQLLPFDVHVLSQQPQEIGYQAAIQLCRQLNGDDAVKEVRVEPRIYHLPATIHR